MDDDSNWFLMKHDDGTVFGPLKFEQLRSWALDAHISPLDKVSRDETNWLKAPMIPELEMDYLVEVSPDQFYGPTTIGALKEFLDAGEIQADTVVTNCKTASEKVISDYIQIETPDTSTEARPVRTSIRRSLQQRIRELEEALLEERRARETAEQLIEKLEAQLAQ